jgi:hypothetical protein
VFHKIAEEAKKMEQLKINGKEMSGGLIIPINKQTKPPTVRV